MVCIACCNTSFICFYWRSLLTFEDFRTSIFSYIVHNTVPLDSSHKPFWHLLPNLSCFGCLETYFPSICLYIPYPLQFLFLREVSTLTKPASWNYEFATTSCTTLSIVKLPLSLDKVCICSCSDSMIVLTMRVVSVRKLFITKI
jgi:hypothetical protein